jgi:hypothetical protein
VLQPQLHGFSYKVIPALADTPSTDLLSVLPLCCSFIKVMPPALGMGFLLFLSHCDAPRYCCMKKPRLLVSKCAHLKAEDTWYKVDHAGKLLWRPTSLTFQHCARCRHCRARMLVDRLSYMAGDKSLQTGGAESRRRPGALFSREIAITCGARPCGAQDFTFYHVETDEFFGIAHKCLL